MSSEQGPNEKSVQPSISLQGRLRDLSRKVGFEMQRAAGKQGFVDGLGRWIFLFAAIPGIFLCVMLVRYFQGEQPNFVALGWVIALAVLLPLLAAWLVARSRLQREVPMELALHEVDRQLDLSDRLRSANEFLEHKTEGGFAAASIEDAKEHLKRAETEALQQTALTLEKKGVSALWILVGCTLLLLGGQVALWTFAGTPNTDDPLRAGRAGNPLELEESEADLEPEPDPEVEPDSPAQERRNPTGAGADAKPSKPSPDLSDEVKESAGKSGEGQSAGAQSTSAASQSRSAPSSQGQSSKPEKPSAKKAAKKKRPDNAEVPEPEAKPKAEEDSGSTAGRGSSKGSNKNPTTSAWKSKDQVTNEDDQEIEDDEEAEDDEEEQESRGGVQPHMRDRRPPVSRDLQIGFGNRPSPDANGRGGPSQQKKSRGVASLVLGVPIPDRIKGQPGPGPTKVTQERVEPQAESPDPIVAMVRAARTAALGPMAQPDLNPLMRQVVTQYFLNRRVQSK